MADYIEHSYRANPGDGASLIAQGRDYVIDSVVTSVTYTAHLHDTLESILQGQEANMDKLAANLEAVSIRAAAVKHGDGMAHLKEQLNSVPTWSMRAPAQSGEIPRSFFSEIQPEIMAAHVRTTYYAAREGAGGSVASGVAEAQREGICYNLSSLDHVGHCMASEDDRQQDAATRQARQVRRPTIEAAGTPFHITPQQWLDPATT